MKFEIWVGRYISKGKCGGVSLRREEGEGGTFQDACIRAFEGDPHFQVYSGRCFHRDRELFPTQEEAEVG